MTRKPTLPGVRNVSRSPSDGDEGDPNSPAAARGRVILRDARHIGERREDGESSPASDLHGRPLEKLLDVIADSEVREAIERGHNYYIKHYLASQWKNNWGVLPTLKQRASVLNQYVEIATPETHASFLEAEQSDFSRYLDSLLKSEPRPMTFSKKVMAVGLFYRHIRKQFDVKPALPGLVFDQFDHEDYEKRLSDPFEREPLTRDEMRRLVDELSPPRNRLMVRLVYQAGLRNSEVRNLKLDDLSLDLEDPHVEIWDSKNGKDRKMAILDELALDLEHWRDVQRPAFSTYAPESEYVFPAWDGVKIEANHTLLRIVHEAAVEAELQKKVTELADGRTKHRVDVHVLRHTGNDHWADSGITLEDRSELLGHEDEETTEKHYSTRTNEATQRRKRFRSDFDPAV